MTRTSNRYVAPEIALLWFGELLLAFIVTYFMMQAPGTRDVLGASWRFVNPRIANHAALFAFTLAGTAFAIGLYHPEICLRPRRVALHAAVVAVLAFPTALAVGGAFGVGLSTTYALWLVKVLALWLVCVLGTRWLLHVAMPRTVFARRVVIVGDGLAAARLVDGLRTRRGAMFDLAAELNPNDTPPSIAQLRGERIWALILADGHGSAPPPWLLDYKMRGVQILDEAGFCERHLGRISLDRLDAAALIGADGFRDGFVARGINRFIDLAISLVMLILTLPLIVATAFAVRFDSPGPILYSQERVGLRGRTFTLFKFRSMRHDAESCGTPRWAAKQDSRITRVGAFIRSTRIDELPQLLNVLRGDMSLVGPRPERPHFVEQLTELIPFYTERSYVKPGITGWAQINYPYGASVEDAREKLAYDLYYVKNRGVLLHFLVLIATVRVILFREGSR